MAKKINWQEHRKQKTARFPHLGGWIGHIAKIIFTLIVAILSFYYLVVPQIKVNYFFAKTSCLVMDKKIQPLAKRGYNPGFAPQFLVIYEVEHKIYTHWAYDILNDIFTDPDAQQAVLSQFKIGQYYNCYYDPKDPNKITLIKEWDRISLLFFLITLIVASASLLAFYRWYQQKKFLAIQHANEK